MSFLRRLSTPRLLALCAAVLVLAAGGTAIASAVSASNPVPTPKPLAVAVHDALAGPAVPGLTARVQFTNHLIDASSLQGEGASPLLTGASGRIWLSADHHLRLELQGNHGGGDSQLVVSPGSFWFYDASSNTVYRGTLPQESSSKRTESAGAPHQLPSVADIQKVIDRLGRRLNVSGAQPSSVSGQPAYTVRLSPRHDGGLLGAGKLAFDAIRGVPLSLGIYAQDSSTPVLELKATDISYGAVPASAFAVSPPVDAKVVQVMTPRAGARDAGRSGRSAHRRSHPDVTGPAAVQAALPFRLSAPNQLVGLPRQSVKLLDFKGSRAALVTYGQGLGGIAVVERAAKAPDRTGTGASPSKAGSSSADAKGSGDHGHGAGLSQLPSISVNGATGHELSTALGTVVTFDRSGVSYTVLGSVPANAAEAAAKGL